MIDNDIIDSLTLEEKVRLCTGLDFWKTFGIKRLNIPSVRFGYGHVGVALEDVAATCFPSPSTIACSWNEDLLKAVGIVIGNEAHSHGVDVLIGPNLGVKRSPLMGRGFLRYSEDPLVVAKMATSFIKGIQQTPTKVAVNSFTVASQETYKRTINTVVDVHAMYDLYLKPFQWVLENTKVDAIMCGYNKVNDVFACENRQLLVETLLKRYRYRGLIMSDWGAINDRIKSLTSGLSLEMPNSGGIHNNYIKNEIEKGNLNSEILDYHVGKIIEFSKPKPEVKKQELNSYQISHWATTESAVLLKNHDKMLPLANSSDLLVVGRFAIKPRIQGVGNSYVHVSDTKSFVDVLKEKNKMYEYSHGYYLDQDVIVEELIQEAVNLARKQQPVVIFLGLTDFDESSNYDRKHLFLPKSQIALLEAIAAVNDNIIAVLIAGSAVDTSWDIHCRSVLKIGLAGNGFGEGLYDLLFGNVNPSGKLTETFPLAVSDLPSYNHFPMGPKYVTYNESVYNGYRYFSSTKRRVKYPFGFGLSYTTFATEVLRYQEVVAENEALSFQIGVANLGKYDGAEVVQMYVSKEDSRIIRPKVTLIGFAKVFVKAGKYSATTITINYQDLAVYDEKSKRFVVEDGEYVFYTSLDLKNPIKVQISGIKLTGVYYHGYHYQNGLDFSVENHQRLVSYPDYKNVFSVPGSFTFNSTLQELSKSIVGKRLYKKAFKNTYQARRFAKDERTNKQIIQEMVNQMPLSSFMVMSDSNHSFEYWVDFLDACNRNSLFGIFNRKAQTRFNKKIKKRSKTSK